MTTNIYTHKLIVAKNSPAEKRLIELFVAVGLGYSSFEGVFVAPDIINGEDVYIVEFTEEVYVKVSNYVRKEA